MLTLAIDTATRWGRFAVADEAGLVVYRPLNVTGSYADALLPVVGSLLEEAGRSRKDLGAIAVAIGPGSFTGIRIGVATAKALAWGLGCPLHGVSSLAAMAAALLAEHPGAELAVPVLDARRGEIFAAVYRRAGSWVEVVDAPAARSGDAWWARTLSVVKDPDLPVYGGEGVHLLVGGGETLRPELAARGEPVLRRWSAAQPATARQLAISVARGAIPACDPFTLVPAYLRVSDAELNRKIDCTPETPDAGISSHHSERGGTR